MSSQFFKKYFFRSGTDVDCYSAADGAIISLESLLNDINCGINQCKDYLKAEDLLSSIFYVDDIASLPESRHFLLVSLSNVYTNLNRLQSAYGISRSGQKKSF
jgi:hypothetical protein